MYVVLNNAGKVILQSTCRNHLMFWMEILGINPYTAAFGRVKV